MGVDRKDFSDAANWQTPQELPDLRRVGIVALDTETRDEGLSVRAIACFRDPDQMRAAVIELIEQGFDANVLDKIDDENPPAIWIPINTIVTTELDRTGFVDWTDHAIQPFRGVGRRNRNLRSRGTMNRPLHPATVQAATTHSLHRDFETRSKIDLKKVGAACYATDPSTEVLWVAFAVDSGPVKLCRPGDSIPSEWFEAAVNPNWTAVAHNDPFESAIEEHKLHPLYGFPIIPPERHRCTQAAALALGLPAKLGLLADVLELINRKDATGERLMHLMSKPRKPRFGEDPKGTYWHEDEPQLQRLGSYCMVDVEVEREAYGRLPQLLDAEQAVWVLSNAVNARGFHVDRVFAEAARKITKAAGPEINDKIKAITAGAVTTIHQVDKLKKWLQLHGCPVTSLDRKVIEKLLEDADGLAVPVRQALTLRLDGAQATTTKLDALLAGAGDDDRIRGALRYCGTSTGRWTGERFQPQNLKRITIEDLDSAIAAVATGDYAHVKALYPQPLSVVGECIRPTIDAAPDHELIGGDFGAVESRVLAWIAGEKWKIDAYHKYDTTKAPSDEPYIQTAAKVLRVNSPVTITKAQRKIGKTCDLAFGYMGGLGAWRNFEPDRYSDAEVEKFKNEWRNAHPRIRQFWFDIDQAAVRAVRDRGEIVRCGPVTLNFSGAFLWIRLPSSRDLAYPYPRIIKDGRGAHRVLFGDNAEGQFKDCRNGRGAYGGVWTENIVSGIARDLLVAAMFCVEAAGYSVVLHVHDELVCEVPIGFGCEEEFVELMTGKPTWAEGLPIAASAWRGPRYCK